VYARRSRGTCGGLCGDKLTVLALPTLAAIRRIQHYF
jgi:hypothetical protein